MLDEDAEKMAKRFADKFYAKDFTMARSPNTEDDYTANKQERDTKAVLDFIGTALFDEIMGGNNS
jgi:hypothetical protein